MIVVTKDGMETEGGNESHSTTVDRSDETIRDRHEKFLAELDNIPMERLNEEGMMSQLAVTLGWTLNEVEVHAYQYFAALTEVSDEDYGTAKSRESVQTGFMKKKFRTRGFTRGPWTPTETRLLQTLMATLAGDHQKNLADRLARFFPDRRPEQIQNQIYFLEQRRRLSEAVDTS
mmetsp:Transcript_7987/g.15517  ORF Transcript_7987/g.15517 Transcript_7987/m.15517 type:complete len:175 (+) Transcript_7987:77-601(+)